MVKLPPTEKLGFGQILAPLRAESTYRNGTWGPIVFTDTEMSLHPAAKVLHYAQEIFEGLKVYKCKQHLALFRPQANISRMAESAKIMAMPPFPEKEFLAAIEELVRRSVEWVPDEPGTLYLRPTMIASTPTLGVSPSKEYLFYILCSPVSGYFGSTKSDVPAVISIQATKNYVRAVRKGLGRAKTGANYAASLRAVHEAHEAGFDNVLFLDAIEQKYLEELSGMNVFIVENGVLKTPPLGDTILAGVTRDSIMQISQEEKIPFKEEPIALDRLLKGVENGSISEMFACGTGAAITSIGNLGFEGKNHIINDKMPGPITTRLYRHLMDIQFGRRIPHQSTWIKQIAAL